MRKVAFLILCVSVLVGALQKVRGQDRVISTAVPFLLIAADARAAGLGDQGVATPVDVFAQQWNPAKYVFASRGQAIGVNYTPYLSDLVSDIFLGNVTYYKRLDERSSFGASIKYFSMGEIEARDFPDDLPLYLNPNELTVDISYGLRLAENFSMAVAGRYIRSDLQLQPVDADASAANSFGVDIAAFYQSDELILPAFNGQWRAGANLSNIGPKIKYDAGGRENFIPTNLKLGVGFDFIFDATNSIGTYLEVNKLLVPTPPGDPEDLEDNNQIGAIERFGLRAGFRYVQVDLDMPYLFSTTEVVSPLEGTLRFGLTFPF